MKTKLIPTPERLLELWREYLVWCTDNPIKRNDFRGKDNTEVWLKVDRPPTMEAFQAWLSQQDIIRDLKHYFANTDGAYNEFKEVISQIRIESHGAVLTGALTNLWNANLAGRYLGIASVTEQKVIHELDTSEIQSKLSDDDKILFRELIDRMYNGSTKAIDRRQKAD